MSSKAGTSKESVQNKSSSKKTVTTRHNSFQTQRQLRNRDRSMKSVTQLLKGNPRNRSYTQTKPAIKQAPTRNNEPGRFKLDDITNVPLIKTITVKHRDHIEPTVQSNKQKTVKTIKSNVNKSTQPKLTPKSPESIKDRPITAKPITSKPTPAKSIIDTIQPNVTIKCIKRKKNQKRKGKTQDSSSQFHPSIEKRQISLRNDWLKHKHAYKTVCRVNGVVRRKLYVPKQGLKTQTLKHRVPQSVSKDLDMKELVQLADDEGLDDDDLMEILTCPSPVWWENPGDDEYLEDAIPIQVAVDTRFINDELSKNHDDKTEIDNIPLFDVKINKSDKKFMQKRSKLETLLGNMKNTTHLPSKVQTDDSLSNSFVNKDINDGEKIEKPINFKDSFREDACDVEIKINEDEINKQDIDESQNDKTTKKENDNFDVSEFAELIEVNHDKDQIKIDEDVDESKNTMSEDPNILDVDIIDTENVTNNVESNKNNELEINVKENSNDSVRNTREPDNRTSISSDEMFYESFSDEILNDLENINIPIENREVIEIIDDDIKENSEQTSLHTTDSLRSTPEDKLDSISDTNIKFIDDKNEEAKPGTSKDHLNPKNIQNNQTNDIIRIKIKNTYKELMQNMSCNDVSYVYAPLKTESGNNMESKDNVKTVSESDKITYCFKCLSIFEMDSCQNCKKNQVI